MEREALEGLVVDAFRRHKGRCGCRRIDRELRRGGIVASGKRVPHIMRKPGIAAKERPGGTGPQRRRSRAARAWTSSNASSPRARGTGSGSET
ncbi:IS3 family transposase [Slackia exigua]|uniref:IS3 family transposase n=1 Tax=Slackia exigua TaxID=84109 RepID=UPI003AB9A73B